MTKDISYYIFAIQNMKRANVQGYLAPHKPVLLLAILQLVELDYYKDNRILLDDKLIESFKKTWRQYVDDYTIPQIHLTEDFALGPSGNYPFKCTIDTPFYHLQGEPFWRLEKSTEYVARPTYSISAIRKCFEYAEIDAELFELIKDEQSRSLLSASLKELI